VKIKVQKAKAKAIIAREERDTNAHSKASATFLDRSLGIPLLCPLIDQGLAYFMRNYAVGLELPPMQSEAYNKHLSTYGFHPIISTSMTAVGLAGVANLCMDHRLRREAMKWYSKALSMTNKALASPSEVKSDNTLFATILLSVFESTSNETTLMGWVNHVTGSASLCRMRGKAQFATPVGRRMYLQTIGMLAIKCLGEGVPLPDFVHDLNGEVAEWEDKNDPGNLFYHLHIAAADFRAQVLRGELTSLHAIVDRALEIDESAQHIFDHVDGNWIYTVENCAQGTPGVFGTSYHVYPSLAAAQTWNWVHYLRIFVLDIVRNSLMAGLSTTPPVFVGARYIHLLEKSTLALYKMQADIIASMPQHMHDTPKVPMSHSSIHDSPEPTIYTSQLSNLTQPANLSTSPHPPPTKLFTSNFLPNPLPASHYPSSTYPATPRDQLPIIRVSGGYSSLFALFIAGATPIASPESQEYVIKTLKRVGVEYGINQAKLLANVLEIKIGMDRVGWTGLEERRGEGAWEVVPDYMPGVGQHLEV